jgi:Tol biopolymer transport system component
MHFAGALKIGISVLVICASDSWAQVTQRLSIATSGGQANGISNYSSISADGRYVAFHSAATGLVVGDTNGVYDIFVRDRQLGRTERVSIDSLGAQANGDSYNPSISGDGRYVAFRSLATNLGDAEISIFEIFIRDRQLGITELVSVDSARAPGNNSSDYPAVSGDGRYVAFVSLATNLVAGDTNLAEDIFVRDRVLGTTERVSVDSSGTQANGHSYFASISGDGRYVAFASLATNLVAGGTSGVGDIFVRDRQLGTTQCVSVDPIGSQGNGQSINPSISADGRYVAFPSAANNLVAGDTNGVPDVFVRDLQLNTTERISIDSSGGQANGQSSDSSLSADGRYVAFASLASNLAAGDTNAATDIFVRDRQLGLTQRVSIDSAGDQGNNSSDQASISFDGRFVAFASLASNLVADDTNGVYDIFVHDRSATGFASLCDSGVAGVIACPCANSPSGPGRGCDNSSSTGGASLAASGIAYVSTDTLVFSTSGEKPTATSIVMQGNALLTNGIVFGQGVRCVGGTLKRLYTKTATGGSITTPEVFDPPVSDRSAALGDPISAGQSRWYLVYYRDPIVLGGCPATSTFNATQTARIDWSL